MGEFLEVAIGMRNRKGNQVKKESDEDKKKRQGPRRPGDKKRGIRCPKVDPMGRQAKCMIITLMGSDEVGVAEEVRNHNKDSMSVVLGRLNDHSFRLL